LAARTPPTQAFPGSLSAWAPHLLLDVLEPDEQVSRTRCRPARESPDGYARADWTRRRLLPTIGSLDVTTWQEGRPPTELEGLRQGIPAWEAEALMLIDPKPECILTYLFEVVWKIQPVRRDHPHSDPRNWADEPPAVGMSRTHCKICGDFIGYRPHSKAERSSKQRE
jgi:hypothetical protein